MSDPAKPKRIVVCPFKDRDDPSKRCGAEVNLSEVDECPKCGRNVQLLLDRDEYEEALSYWRQQRQTEGGGPKKKKSGYPFAS